MMEERGKVVKWSLEMTTVSATEHLKQKRKELANHLKEEKKRFAAGEEVYDHLLLDIRSWTGASDAKREIRQMSNSEMMRRTWLKCN